MLTDEQISTIAYNLEDYFNDNFMKTVYDVERKIRKIFSEHKKSGGYEICKESKLNFDNFLVVSPFWERVWFHPGYETEGEVFACVTKGLGEGCHFCDDDCGKKYYNRFHDMIFGSHFYPTNWARTEGSYTRKTTEEFVREHLSRPDTILNVKNRIDEIASTFLPELKKLPKLVKDALAKSVKYAKSRTSDNEKALLEGFGLAS